MIRPRSPVRSHTDLFIPAVLRQLHTGRSTEVIHDTKGVTLQSYADVAITADWTEAERYRAIVVSLPRRLHDLDRGACAAVLKEAPSLTDTPWDALLAAVAEHTALRDGHELQPWLDEPARFLDAPWFPNLRAHHLRLEALWHSPATFLRHGTPAHPSELDPRGGDAPWRPYPSEVVESPEETCASPRRALDCKIATIAWRPSVAGLPLE